MRSILALSVLIAVAAAQETFSIGNPVTTSNPTTTADVEPSATETVSGPISTASACAQIANLVKNSEVDSPSVEAEVR